MTNDPQTGDELLAAQAESVLMASRLLVGIAAQSISLVEESLSLPQMRALVILITQGEMDLSRLAKAMGVHASNATRTCDRLVASGLVERRSNKEDRRHVRMVPTDLGRSLFEEITQRRRVAIAEVLGRMAPSRRVAVARALTEFSRAGGEIGSQDLLTLGWGAGQKVSRGDAGKAP